MTINIDYVSTKTAEQKFLKMILTQTDENEKKVIKLFFSMEFGEVGRLHF